MTSPAPAANHGTAPALRRLATLTSLDRDDLAVLEGAAAAPRLAKARRDMTDAVWGTTGPVLILEGWAFRSYLLADGRRQITDVLLPGDVLTNATEPLRDALSVTAVTPVSYCTLPSDVIAARPGILAALQHAHALEFLMLRRHVVRLGRLDALERIVDWALELYDRCDATGLCSGDTMPLPLTQEVIADALGLTSVHVSRTLSVLRREELLSIQDGRIAVLNRNRCRSMIGWCCQSNANSSPQDAFRLKRAGA